MNKSQAIQVLEEFAILLELKNENMFKIRAFQNAARTLGNQTAELQELYSTGQLKELPGIGKGIFGLLEDLLQKGKSEEFEKLKKEFPEGVFDLFQIPGLGAKRVKILYEKLHIDSLAILEEACKNGKLRDLDGFGEKTEAAIIQGIEQLKKTSGVFLLSEALDSAEALKNHLKKNKDVLQVEIAGSLRRAKELIHDADLVVSTENPKRVHEAFTSYPGISRVLAHGDTKSMIVLSNGMQADLRTVTPEEFPSALLYFTGSKEHGVKLRAAALKKKLKLNEYGLWKGKKRIAASSEKDIYEELGYVYVPPEAREDAGELEPEAAKRLSRLIEERDIKGIFHVHSNYSDGTAPLEDMVRESEALGYDYVGISDHSQSAVYANGLKKDRVIAQWKELDRLQKKVKIRIFKGIESDILADGSLDYPDDFLAKFDFVIGSVHSRFKMNEDQMTERIMKAMDNRYLTFVGHPTGRKLLSREGYGLDFGRLFDHAKATGAVLELNADPQRLDLDWRVCRKIQEHGLPVSIHPDAHSVSGLRKVKYGVGMARKAWLQKNDVINTQGLKEIEMFLRRRK